MSIENKDSDLIEAWKKSEDVAMHFNLLLSGFRLKAIGGIALGAVAGIGLKLSESDKITPTVIFAVFLCLTIIWILVWAADFLYYYRLLAGAVDELLRLEKLLGKMALSHLIERRVQGLGQPEGVIGGPDSIACSYPPKYPRGAIFYFYLIPGLLLGCTAVGFGLSAFCRH